MNNVIIFSFKTTGKYSLYIFLSALTLECYLFVAMCCIECIDLIEYLSRIINRNASLVCCFPEVFFSFLIKREKKKKKQTTNRYVNLKRLTGGKKKWFLFQSTFRLEIFSNVIESIDLKNLSH